MAHKQQSLRDLERVWLAATPRSEHTLRAYRTELDRLARFLRSYGCDEAGLEPPLLERFWRELIRGGLHDTSQPPSASTIDQSRRILSAFIRWLVQQEMAPVALLATVLAWRTPKGVKPVSNCAAPARRALPLSCLLQVSDLDGAAASLCFWVGATPSELASLAGAHVKPSSAKVTLTQRGISRTVAMPRPLAKSLNALIRADQPWVFGRGGVPSTPAAIAQRVARWLNRFDGSNVSSARALRAYFQCYAEARGWNSDEIRGQLRRSSLPPRQLASPSHRRLAVLIPSSR
jgi:site-specific recombinase XerC